MSAALLAGAALLGLVLGSFATVVISRVPAERSLVQPGSACPACAAPVRWRDNVPVLSWLLLRGRCRDCRAPIPARYPLTELAVAGVFVAVTARVGWDPALPAYLLFAWTLVVLAVIDARTRRIPNRLTYPLVPILIVLFAAAALVAGEPGRIAAAALGGLAAFAALLVLALISPGGMGMGDVKLAGLIGIGLGSVGWGVLLLGIFAGFLLGGLVSVVLLATRSRRRKDLIPFGPYLAAGALVALLAGEALIDAYQRALGVG